MENRISDPWKLVEDNLEIVTTVINNRITLENRVGFEYADLFQEGCIYLYKAATTFDSFKGATFRTYAYCVVSNGLCSYCKKQKNEQKSMLLYFSASDIENEVEDIVDGSVFDEFVVKMEILDLLNTLKKNYKGTARLGIEAIEFRVRGLTNTEIAKLYGIKPNLVGARISRALQKLRNNPIFNLYIADFTDSK